MKNNHILTCILTLTVSLSVYTDAQTAAAYSLSSKHAAAAGMGEAHTSFVKNAHAIFWNPAQLAFQTQNEISISSSQEFEAQSTNIYTTLPWQLPNLKWGLGYRSVTVDGIYGSRRDGGRGVATGENLDYEGSVIFLSLAKKLREKLSIGSTIKLLGETAGNNKAKATALDLGFQYNFNKRIQFGINSQNLYHTDYQWDTQSQNVDDIPTITQGGFTTHWFNSRLAVVTELRKREGRDTTFQLGASYALYKIFHFRAGLNDSRLSAGLGMILGPISTDFSWSDNDSNDLNDLYRVSFGYRFN